ncbi:PREDICTED: protein MIS12 homolog [Priapulus caudatus]|uniref:Protein MIS12 homolog n=1 Tax=Priapulus caudatus TaxID=37621 RepID=A0ABM1DZD6_PRICU|nr:PREDICTED: protein MIS12 homolog [Priapulus caudatus]
MNLSTDVGFAALSRSKTVSRFSSVSSNVFPKMMMSSRYHPRWMTLQWCHGDNRRNIVTEARRLIPPSAEFTMSVEPKSQEENVTDVIPRGSHDAARVQQYEYETQHFMFTPKSFIDGVYNQILVYINDGITAMQGVMKKQFPEAESELNLEDGYRAILSRYIKVIDQAFDKLESYLLRNIFHIPEDVLLPEDEVHSKPYSVEDDALLDAQLESLQKQIMALNYTNACLRSELQDINIVETKCTEAQEELRKLTQILKDYNVTQCQESLHFLHGSGEVLLNNLQQVETLMQSSSTTPEGSKTAQKRDQKKARLGESTSSKLAKK